MPDAIVRDCTHRFMFDNTDIRGEIVSLEDSYQQLLIQQNLPDVLLPILGQFTAAVALLSETLKFEGILTLQVRGDGNVPLIMTEATNNGHVRGIMKVKAGLSSDKTLPDNNLFDTSNLKSLVGNGVLTLTIDPTQGERYQGIVPLEGEQLSDCLGHYFEKSEQLPTRVWLFADAQHCGGLMLQSLPAQHITDPEMREEHWNTALQLANTLKHEELFEHSHEHLLYRLFHEMSCRVFPARKIQFTCSCTRDRSENAIMSLGKEEALLLANERGKIAIDCQFCGKHYAFKEADIEQLFSTKGPAPH